MKSSHDKKIVGRLLTEYSVKKENPYKSVLAGVFDA